MRSFAEARAVRVPAITSTGSRPRAGSFVILLLTLYYLPPLLLLSGVLRFAWRFQILAVMTAFLIAYDWRRGLGLRELGFRKDTLRGSLLINLLVSLLLISVMSLSFKAGLIREPTPPAWNLFFTYYLFISSPSQEFLFRSNLFALMRRGGILHPAAQVVLSAVTFSFLHVFYKDPLTLLATFIIGLLWGAIYYKYPNFWGVALSHAAVGAAAIKVGII